MTKQVKKSATYRLQYPVLAVIGKLLLNLIITSMLLAFGFWLLIASNMGPAYLPHIMDGVLDFWIRTTLLGLGLGVWLITVVWLIWLILRYFYTLPNSLIKRHR